MLVSIAETITSTTGRSRLPAVHRTPSEKTRVNVVRQKNGIKKIEEWRQLGAFMFPVAHQVRQTTRERSGWRGRIVGGGLVDPTALGRTYLVGLTLASWNLIGDFLRRLDALKQAA